MVNNMYDRAGAAYAAGAPIGASVNIAQMATSESQASAFGGAFATAQSAPNNMWTPTSGQVQQAQVRAYAPLSPALTSFQKKAAEVDAAGMSFLGRAMQVLNTPVRYVGDYAEAMVRTKRNATNGTFGQQITTFVTGLGVMQFLDPEFRRQFSLAQQAQASPAQTLWLGIKSEVAPDATAPATDPFALLDNQSRLSERDEYFSAGLAKWATGAIDLAFNFTADPLIVGGKGVKILANAKRSLTAADVESAMSKGAQMSTGGRRFDAFMNRTVDGFETVRNDPGAAASMLANKTLTQGADSGMILAAQRMADSVVDDTARLALRKNIIAAGFGHRPSIAALEQQHKDIWLAIQRMTGPNQEAARAEILGRVDEFTHLQNLRDAHVDDWTEQLVQHHTDYLTKQYEALSRVIRGGNPAMLSDAELAATKGMGDLTHLSLGDALGYAKTVHTGLGMPPIHMLFGRKIPGNLVLDSDDSYQSFASFVMNVYGVKRKALLPDEGKALLDDYATAWSSVDAQASRIARRAIVDRANTIGRKRIVDSLYARYKGAPLEGDMTADYQKISSLVHDVLQKRTDSMHFLRERAYQALDEGKDIGWVVEDGGVYAFRAEDVAKEFGPREIVQQQMDGAGRVMSPTQVDASVTLHDFEQVRKAVQRHILSQQGGLEGYVRKVTTGGDGQGGLYRVTRTTADILDQLWKFGALFRPGYVVRNLIDEGSRDLAMIGFGRYLSYAREGLRNFKWNAGRVPEEIVTLSGNRAALLSRIDDLDVALARPGVDVMKIRQEKFGIELQIQQIETALEEAFKKGSGKKVFVGSTPMARHIGIDATDPKAVFSSVADYKRGRGMVNAEESILGLAATSQSSHLGALRMSRSGQWKVVDSTNPLWKSAYVDFINNRVRNDKALMDMLAGASDDVIKAYYRSDAEGMAKWRGFGEQYGWDLDEYVAKMHDQLDKLVPNDVARSRILGGAIDEKSIDTIFTEGTRPGVPADMLKGEDPGMWFDMPRKWWYRYAGQLPEEQLGRMPFFVERSKSHMEAMWPKAADGSDVSLTLAQVNELRLRAMTRARRDVGNYLFDTSSRSNLSAMTRFLFPFYNAWSDSMRKWIRIFGYNPASLGYATQTIQSFNSGFVVVDGDGNRILRDGTVVKAVAGQNGEVRYTREVIGSAGSPFDGYILFPIPKWLSPTNSENDHVAVAKNALNVTFQGEPFWLPSPGPLMAIPASTISNKWYPELGSTPVGKWLLPYGASKNVQEAVLPTWARNLNTLANAEFGNFADSRVSQTYAQILADKVNQIERGQAGDPDEWTQKRLLDYADNATKNWWTIRFLSNWFGFTAQPGTKLEFYQQEYRRMRREFGDQADENFLAAYPDFYEATISLSVNETGISATDDTWAASQRYATAINRNKEYGWAYVGAANLAPGFSDGVYTAQQTRGWRSTKDPVEAFNDLQVSNGWRQYNQVNNAVQEELARRKALGGPASITAGANEDLWNIRRNFIEQLTAQNPKWADEFEKGGTAASVGEFYRWAEGAVQDYPELASRSDFVALDDYMQVRQAIRDELDRRGLATVDSKGAEDLSEIWANFTLQMQQQDLGFQQMFTRAGLDRDNVGR